MNVSQLNRFSNMIQQNISLIDLRRMLQAVYMLNHCAFAVEAEKRHLRFIWLAEYLTKRSCLSSLSLFSLDLEGIFFLLFFLHCIHSWLFHFSSSFENWYVK